MSLLTDLEPASLTDAEKLFVDFPLYHKRPVNQSDVNFLQRTAAKNLQFDWYCPMCQTDSTFKEAKNIGGGARQAPVIWDVNTKRSFGVTFFCSRDETHALAFGFTIENRHLIKMMQYPSAAELSAGDVRKYKKLLKDDGNEFTKAIGLFAHGVGIGSFVYLRRIIERLVEEAHNTAKNDSTWNEEPYSKAKFPEKIKLLAVHLPAFLSENSNLYGIISKGIHSLSEEECLDAFPIIRTSIELILDDKLEMISREEKTNRAKKELGKLAEKHSQPEKKTPPRS